MGSQRKFWTSPHLTYTSFSGDKGHLYGAVLQIYLYTSLPPESSLHWTTLNSLNCKSLTKLARHIIEGEFYYLAGCKILPFKISKQQKPLIYLFRNWLHKCLAKRNVYTYEFQASHFLQGGKNTELPCKEVNISLQPTSKCRPQSLHLSALYSLSKMTRTADWPRQ